MTQESGSDLQRPEPDTLEFVDLQRMNPWWADESAIPTQTLQRTDLYWRVKNTLEHSLVIIPGAPVTGTGTTFQQLIRALILGDSHDSEPIASLFHDSEVSLSHSGCSPEQVCYVDCSDPLAYLVDGFVNDVRKKFHKIAAGTGELELFLLLDNVFCLDDWRKQLLETHALLSNEFPEDWTIIATVPTSGIATEADFTDVDGEVIIDRPHLTQKFRDTLVIQNPNVTKITEERNGKRSLLDQARHRFEQAVLGNCSAEQLEEDFQALQEQLLIVCDEREIAAILNQYLTFGGFESAIQTLPERPTKQSDNDWNEDQIKAVSGHIQNGLETTIYKDIPRLATVESSIPRIEDPEKLHALFTFLTRRGFGETSYKGLAESVLKCDPRTIRQKYVPILETLHISAQATRYDLERNRTLRFYPRSPGYLTASRGQGVSPQDFDDRLRIALSDHLRRLLAKYNSDGGLQYWYDGAKLVDFIFDVQDTPVTFVSAFSDSSGGTVDAFSSFAESVGPYDLEVVIMDSTGEVTVTRTESDRMRLHLPQWLLLTLC